MWGLFTLAAVVGAVFLFAPGYLFLRAGRLPYWLSLSAAPAVSVACYSVICVTYGVLSMSCSWASVFAPVFFVAAAAFAVSKFMVKGNDAGWNASDALPIAAYAIAGIGVTCGVYLCQIVVPDAFIQSWDNVHHLDAVRAFVDSGRWSSLGTTLYLGQDAAIDPFVEGSFYPSAWHAYAAMIASACGLSAPMAINVANFVIVALAFPLGTYAFLRSLFPGGVAVVASGALFVLANASCPWMMLTWGPLYPNVMANCLLPGLMAAFVVMLSDGAARSLRIACGCTVFAGVLSFVFVQPNGVFTAVVLLAPYLVSRVYSMAKRSGFVAERGGVYSRWFAGGCAALALIVIVAFWVIAFNAPFMQQVVQYRWPYDSEVADALLDVVTQRFHVPGLAIGCALLLGVGIVSAIARKRQRWLVFSWLFACTVYVVCVSVDGYWHQFFAGFWYTDVPRVASIAALAAVPLQALGLAELVGLASQPFKGKKSKTAANAAMVVIIAVLLYVPVAGTDTTETDTRVFSNANALGVEGGHIAYEYRSDDPLIYDSAERAFVQEALSLIPEGSIVINEPNDGSAYAYGVDGLRTYYRYWRGYGEADGGEKPESVLIREQLKNIAKDEDVKAAVSSVGATYVIQLDRGEPDWNYMMWLYGDGELWRGIDGINRYTSGFELVLERDDMRLYKILM